MSRTYRPNASLRYIVIHYSATPVEQSFSGADIDRMHRERGFRSIGYHRYIRRSGAVEVGRDLDQPGRFEQGAHALPHNQRSIGICYEGGVTRADRNRGFDSRTPEQIAAMTRLIDELLERFPQAEVIGHRDLPGAATQCPGFDAGAWWRGVLAGRAAARPSPAAPQALDGLIAQLEQVLEELRGLRRQHEETR